MEEQGVKRYLDIEYTGNSEKKAKVSLDLSHEENKEKHLLEERRIYYVLPSSSQDVDQTKNETISVDSLKADDAEPNSEDANDDLKPSLLGLNDLCLCKVFSYLGIYDVTNIANTCVRFRNWAKYVFERHHKLYINFDWRPEGHLSQNEVREAVRIFGPQIKEIAVNVIIFNELFSSESGLSKVNEYCNNLDTITLNNLQFTKWFPQKSYFDITDDSSDDGWNDYDSDEDSEWRRGDVSPKFLTNLPRVKNVVINSGVLYCGYRLFDNWKNQIENIVIKDVLIGEGFLKAFRELYNETRMIGHNEVRTGRDNREYRNFRIVEASFTPKAKKLF